MANGDSLNRPRPSRSAWSWRDHLGGRYTAGVIDFLIQALDQWEKAKEGPDPDCPRHDVSIKVMAGASGGGVNAAIAAAQLGQTFSPVTGLPATAPANNKFFESWVEQIDVAGLLGTRDLDGDQAAMSVRCSIQPCSMTSPPVSSASRRALPRRTGSTWPTLCKSW